MQALPVEILESIFAECIPDAVYIATHVCKTWRDVIFHSHYVLDVTLTRLLSRYGTLVLPKSQVRHINQLRDLFEHLCYTNFLGSWLFVKPMVVDSRSIRFRNYPDERSASECLSKGLSQMALRCVYRGGLGTRKYPELEAQNKRNVRVVIASKTRLFEVACVLRPKAGKDSVATYLLESVIPKYVYSQFGNLNEIEMSSSISEDLHNYKSEGTEIMTPEASLSSSEHVKSLTKQFASITIVDKEQDLSVKYLTMSSSGVCAILLNDGSLCIQSMNNPKYLTSPCYDCMGYFPTKYPSERDDPNAPRAIQETPNWTNPIDMAVKDDGTIILLHEDGFSWLRREDQLSWEEHWESRNSKDPVQLIGNDNLMSFRSKKLPRGTIIKRIECTQSETDLLLYPGHLPLHSHCYDFSKICNPVIIENKIPFYEVLVGSQMRPEFYAIDSSIKPPTNMTVLGQQPNFLRIGPLLDKRLLLFKSQVYNTKISIYYTAIALDSKTGNFVLVRSEIDKSDRASRMSLRNASDRCWKVVAKIHGIKEDELQEKFKSHGDRCTKFATSRAMNYSGKISSISNFKPKDGLYKSIAFAIGNEIYVVCVDMCNMMPVPTSLEDWRGKRFCQRQHSSSYNHRINELNPQKYATEFFEEDVIDLHWQKFTVKEPVQELGWITTNNLAVFCTTEIVHLTFNEKHPRRTMRNKRDDYVPYHMKGDY